MIVARLKPGDKSFHYTSLDITPEQNHAIRCGIDISNQLQHLTDWERNYLIKGIIPKSKMSTEEYFSGFNYNSWSVNQQLKYLKKL